MKAVVKQGKKTFGYLVPLAAMLLVPLVLAPERWARVLASTSEWLGDGRVFKLAAVANALTMIP